MNSRRPTASERTVSLFTGQTDAEGGGFARDGTSPERPRVDRSAKPRPKWIEERHPTHYWECKTLLARIEERGGVYTTIVRGKVVGSFSNIHDAANAAERG